MTAADLLIEYPHYKDLQKVVHDLVQVHNKLVYHIFNSPHDPVTVDNPKCLLTPRQLLTINALCICVSDVPVYHGPVVLCKLCGKIKQDDSD